MNIPNRMNKIEIVVTADIETGHVEVRGPLAHKLLCIKTLATAFQIVVDHVPPVIARAMPRPPAAPSTNGGAAH